MRAPADGYTLLIAGAYNAINATLYDKLNFIRDITAVAGIVRVPNVMVVHPSVPATTVPEFIAYAKTSAGKINCASAGKTRSFGDVGSMSALAHFADPSRTFPKVREVRSRHRRRCLFDPVAASL